MEAATGQPLVDDDVPLNQVEVAELERQYEIPSISHQLQADLGDRITLLGYDLEAIPVEPGGTVNLILYWQARGRVWTSYTVFTHLLDSEQRIWGQRDSIPVMGTRPTTGFLPGEVIADAYVIPVDRDAPSGKYVLEIGMYDAQTAERLPVVVDGIRMPDDRLLVSTILVEPELTTAPLPSFCGSGRTPVVSSAAGRASKDRAPGDIPFPGDTSDEEACRVQRASDFGTMHLGVGSAPGTD